MREPIDMVIREKIIELAWKYGDGVLPSQIKDSLESYVEEELFKGWSDIYFFVKRNVGNVELLNILFEH